MFVLRRGTELLGYRIEALVGRGGMGVVYRAYDPRLKRNVALKLIAPELSGEEHFRERFLSEIEIAASLEHPSVIPIYDAGEVDGQLYLVMRYVEGSDLKTLLAEHGALEPARALAICSQVAGALDHAHGSGLVHRDVKPSNVLLDPREHVYLADFGLSRRLAEPGLPPGPGLSVGTPAYAAPEQIAGGVVDGRADVYSLGCVLHECLTGNTPFERDSELAVLWAHVQEPPPKASERKPGLPASVDGVIATALAKDADDRYAGCSELLAAAADALGIAAPTRPFWSRGPVVVLLAFALVAAGVGIWTLVQRSGSKGSSSSSVALAAAANAQRAAHPDEALLLALEAVRAEATPQARASMIAALERARSLGVRTIVNARAGPVSDVAFSPDGQTMASANGDTIQLWNTRANRRLAVLGGDAGIVNAVAFSPAGHTLASAGNDQTVRLWDTRTDKQLAVLRGHTGSVLGLAFSPDGRTLASASNDETVRLWSLTSHRQLEVLRGHTDAVTAVSFSPDGRVLASAGDRTVRLWNVARGKQAAVLHGPPAQVNGVVFSRDGRMLASAGDDQAIRLWDARTLRPLGVLHGHTSPVSAVAFTPDGRTLASAGSDSTVRLWDVHSKKQLRVLYGYTGTAGGIAFSPDGQLLAAASNETVRLWDIRAPKAIDVLRGHTDVVNGVAFSPDGRALASAGNDGVRLWDTRSHLELAVRHDQGGVLSVAFSPDGSTLASGGADQMVRLRDTRRLQRIAVLDNAEGGVLVAFSPDGQTLAAASPGFVTRLWDWRRHTQVTVLNDGGPIAFSPDGRTLAIGARSAILLRDTRTRRPLPALRFTDNVDVTTVAFSPDGHTLAAGTNGTDQAVRLWDTRSHKPLAVLHGDNGFVLGVAFSPDGTTLASAGNDTVRLWDTRSHSQLAVLRGGGQLQAVAYSPDGRSIAAAGYDPKTVRLWQGIVWRDLADLEQQVCSLVVGNLTKNEWQQAVPGVPYHTSCAG